MLPRFAANNVEEALADTPVVIIMGPRQSGKATLIKTLLDETWEYVTPDDQAQLGVAGVDPVVFVKNPPPRRVALGEVHRPGVLLHDGDRTTAFGEHLFAVPVGAPWP